MTAPTFSILTPTLDRPEFLQRAVASVLAQTDPDFELIVYDVGETPVFARGDPLPDPRIRYYRGERAGPAADFQAALDLARGQIVHPLADDDQLPPHALETVRAKIGDSDWLIGMTVLVNTAGYPVAIRGGTTAHLQDTIDGQYMLGGAVYWRKALSDRVGGFKSEFDGAADFDLYLRFAKDGEPRLVHEILYVYTDHPDTDSRQNRDRQADAAHRITAAR